jgi:hypothetical protein
MTIKSNTSQIGPQISYPYELVDMEGYFLESHLRWSWFLLSLLSLTDWLVMLDRVFILSIKSLSFYAMQPYDPSHARNLSQRRHRTQGTRINVL